MDRLLHIGNLRASSCSIYQDTHHHVNLHVPLIQVVLSAATVLSLFATNLLLNWHWLLCPVLILTTVSGGIGL